MFKLRKIFHIVRGLYCIAGESDLTKEKEAKKRAGSNKIFLRTLIPTILIISIARAVGAFIKPGGKEYFSSLSTDPDSLSILIKILVAGAHFLITCFLAFTLLFNPTVGVLHASIVGEIVRESR